MNEKYRLLMSLSIRRVLYALLLSFLAESGTCVSVADSLRTVALSGDLAPGVDSEVYLVDTRYTFPLGDGLVGFFATLTGPDITRQNDGAIWIETNVGLSKVVQRGDVAPGVPNGGAFGGRLNPLGFGGDAGGITADTVGPNHRAGMWHYSVNRGLEPVIISGDPAPGFTDENIRISAPNIFNMNRWGQIAFAGQFGGPGVVGGFNYGSWMREGTGEVRLVARSGDPVPGMSSEFVMDGRFLGLQLSDSGRLAMTADLREYQSSEHVGSFTRRNVLLSENGAGTLAVVAFEGQPAPGVDDGAAFGKFSHPIGRLALSGDGTMAFTASLTGENVTDFNARGLWTDRTGNGMSLLARAGDTPPGLGVGHHWFGFGNLSINNHDEIAFSANFNADGIDGFRNGIWLEEYGSLELVARTGDTLPGLPEETFFNFGQLYRSSNHPVALLNAFLTGSAVDDTNDRGLWGRSSTGELVLIARKGDQLNVSNDPTSPDLRTVSSLINGGIDNLGYISFAAYFTDGTKGVFVSSAVAIPEPSAAVLLGTALSFLCFRRF